MHLKQARDFINRYGVVLQSARGPVPNLAEVIAGEPIRGSWWGHPKGKEIFRTLQAVCESPDILVCKLIEGKITLVHRRLWPALVKLAPRWPKERLSRIREEHTPSGKHVLRRKAFPGWVPPEVTKDAKAMSLVEAEKLMRSVQLLP